MILNSKTNQFVFRFPKNFIPEDVEKKYNFYLKKLPTPFENILDYVNHTIQSVTFPSVTADVVEQVQGRRTFSEPGGAMLTKNPQIWRQTVDLEKAIDKSFTVQMKAADGYLNYWVLFETFRRDIQITNEEEYIPDMNMIYLDYAGYQLLTVDFKQPLFVGLSEIEMNYANVTLDFRTISATFRYNTFDINVKTD